MNLEHLTWLELDIEVCSSIMQQLRRISTDYRTENHEQIFESCALQLNAASKELSAEMVKLRKYENE